MIGYYVQRPRYGAIDITIQCKLNTERYIFLRCKMTQHYRLEMQLCRTQALTVLANQSKDKIVSKMTEQAEALKEQILLFGNAIGGEYLESSMNAFQSMNKALESLGVKPVSLQD